MIKRSVLLFGIGLMLACNVVVGQNSTLNTLPDSTVNRWIPKHFMAEENFSIYEGLGFNFKSMKPLVVFPKYAVTGVFCKMEHRIEATSNFAPRFRLGSVNYTDWMEGKKPFLSRYSK